MSGAALPASEVAVRSSASAAGGAEAGDGTTWAVVDADADPHPLTAMPGNDSTVPEAPAMSRSVVQKDPSSVTCTPIWLSAAVPAIVAWSSPPFAVTTESMGPVPSGETVTLPAVMGPLSL
jgi:hypothetical protein